MARLIQKTALLTVLLFAAAPIGGCCDCEEDDDRPPALGSDPPPIGIACPRLASEGFDVVGVGLRVGGELAECASDGMACPVQQTDELMSAAGCEPDQMVQAICQQRYWQRGGLDTVDTTPPPAAAGAAGFTGGAGTAGASGAAGGG